MVLFFVVVFFFFKLAEFYSMTKSKNSSIGTLFIEKRSNCLSTTTLLHFFLMLIPGTARLGESRAGEEESRDPNLLDNKLLQ